MSESGVAWCCIYAQVVLVNCHFDGKHVDGGSFVLFCFFVVVAGFACVHMKLVGRMVFRMPAHIFFFPPARAVVLYEAVFA